MPRCTFTIPFCLLPFVYRYDVVLPKRTRCHYTARLPCVTAPPLIVTRRSDTTAVTTTRSTPFTRFTFYARCYADLVLRPLGLRSTWLQLILLLLPVYCLSGRSLYYCVYTLPFARVHGCLLPTPTGLYVGLTFAHTDSPHTVYRVPVYTFIWRSTHATPRSFGLWIGFYCYRCHLFCHPLMRSSVFAVCLPLDTDLFAFMPTFRYLPALPALLPEHRYRTLDYRAFSFRYAARTFLGYVDSPPPAVLPPRLVRHTCLYVIHSAFKRSTFLPLTAARGC